MSSSYISNLLVTLVVLSLVACNVKAVCEDKYAEASASTGAPPLECSPFAGSDTIYGVVYGCNTPNQDEKMEGIVAQSFTQICTAQVATDTNFTCYGEF